MQRKYFSFITILIALLLIGCKSKYVISNTESSEIARLSADVGYLASDELEGREIGTKGETLAATYNISIFILKQILMLKPLLQMIRLYLVRT